MVHLKYTYMLMYKFVEIKMYIKFSSSLLNVYLSSTTFVKMSLTYIYEYNFPSQRFDIRYLQYKYSTLMYNQLALLKNSH